MTEGDQTSRRLVATAIAAIIFLNVFQNTFSQPSQSAAPVGIKAYRRFHANDSLIGKSILCTKEEKFCFQYNLIFFPTYNICRSLSQDTCDYPGNAFFSGSGHLVLVCGEYLDPCPGYRMAYDGRCYPKEMVRDVICGCDAEPTEHILGGMECRCSPPTPIHVQQPEEDGKCIIPDLRIPDDRKQFERSPHSSLETEYPTALNCSADQARCFSAGKVWMAEGRGCFSLWERGPCLAEHLVVLDGQAALQGRAEGVCVHQRRGCPEGQRRMALDQRCYHDADLELIRTGELTFTEYGNTVWKDGSNSKRNVTLVFSKSNHTNQNKCIINPSFSNPEDYQKRPCKYNDETGKCDFYEYEVTLILRPPCGDDDQSKCNLYEVEIHQPKPSAD